MDNRAYRPHITLATRLDARKFALYKEKLGDFSPKYVFTCSHLSVFHFTNAGCWSECRQLAL